MPISSHTEISSSNYHLDDIPDEHKGIFYSHRDYAVDRYKKFINSVIASTDNIQFPMQNDLLEKYLSGYNFQYIGFDNSLSNMNCEGQWNLDSKTGSVSIYYNTNAPVCRQRFSKAHELIHFCQSADGWFDEFFDGIFHNKDFPPFLITKLLKKITDKTASMYLMPEKYFIDRYNYITKVEGITDIQNITSELSDYFQVSYTSASYRLKECLNINIKQDTSALTEVPF